MDIKKGKVLKDRDWSLKTRKNLASMLGITAALSLSGAALTACNEVVASGGDIEDADSSSSEIVTDGMGPIDDRWQDVSSSSANSSSSEKLSSSIDPVGGISSSSIAPRPNSSSSEDPPLSAGILPPSSSSYEIDTLEVTSGEVIPPEIVGPESGSNIDIGHLESSSSIAEPSSSSYQRIESSSATSGLPLSSWEEVPPSSSSAETEPLPGEPIELDDPKD